MPVKIRLARHGRKNKPYYHIVAADSRAPRDGRYIERIGSYNPNTDTASIDLNFEKALKWIQQGAQPTETCRAILSYKGVLYKNHLLKGVAKGALTEEQAEEKFNSWLKDKEQKIQAKKEKLNAAKKAKRDERLKVESEISKARAEELAKKKAEAEAAKLAEEAAAKAEAEAEAAEEATEEQPEGTQEEDKNTEEA
ncbi:MAG: 30S ribosomal protein S16 [Bacteroidia bacterium]|nr:MAG: 30S ribosomal protein S16 [Bacteroidia bacterium]